MDGRRWLLPAPIVLAVLVTVAVAKKPRGEDVHRPDGDCAVCHSGDAATLRQDPAAARAAIVPDIEARCAPCHGDEGPSHKTGIRPAHEVPPALPLAPDGTIGCATCHYMHGESNAFGDFLRIDNRHGGLCLSCHALSELQ